MSIINKLQQFSNYGFAKSVISRNKNCIAFYRTISMQTSSLNMTGTQPEGEPSSLN
jgi:hypothetical protein